MILITILLIRLVSCEPQLNGLLSSFDRTSKAITDGFLKNPFIKIPIETSANIITDSLNFVTNIPIEIARWYNTGHSLPSLIDDGNLFDLSDQFISDFNIGLKDEDVHLQFEDLVTKYGYPVEKHTIATDDGYVLNLFRIPGNGSAVFLMHGLFGSSDDFVILGPGHGLAYLLADKGYDVWMGNARGNKHSRRHTSLRTSDAAFWDFSWHEIGVYDLPAMIDYVLTERGHQTLQYIGHSQGTTTFFVMISERPEYNLKISLMIALSPVAYMGNVRSPLVRLLAPGTPIYYTASNVIGTREFLPDNIVTKTLRKIICGLSPLSEVVCGNIMFILGGFSLEQLDVVKLPVLLGHVPAGASAKQVAHYGQEVVSGDFRKFDYGGSENVRRYGQNKPPSYNLANIEVPVFLFFSTSDWLAHPTDVYKLAERLENVNIYQVPSEPFSHLDFLWARDFKLLVFEKIRKVLL